MLSRKPVSFVVGYELVRLNGMPWEPFDALRKAVRDVCPTVLWRKRRRRNSSAVKLSAGRSFSFTTESWKSVCRIYSQQISTISICTWHILIRELENEVGGERIKDSNVAITRALRARIQAPSSPLYRAQIPYVRFSPYVGHPPCVCSHKSLSATHIDYKLRDAWDVVV